MKTLDVIALTLLIVGGLNWLLVGLLEFSCYNCWRFYNNFSESHLYCRRYLCYLLFEILSATYKQSRTIDSFI